MVSRATKRSRKSGKIQRVAIVRVKVSRPRTRKDWAALKPSGPLRRAVSAEASSTPHQLKKLPAARIRPRFSRGARNWTKACNGTRNRPALMPRNRIRITWIDKLSGSRNRPQVQSARPSAPSGTTPNSTLRPDKRPESSEPMPMPSAATRNR